MKRMNPALCIFLMLLLAPLFLNAISVTASVNKNTITTADRLEYTIQVSSEDSFTMSEPAPPEIPNFSFVNMRSASSSSTSITGFKAARKISRSFIYYYIPKAEGNSKIPAQQIRIVNKVYSTPEFEISVVKAVGSRPSQSGPGVNPFDVFEDPNLSWPARRIQGNTLLLALLQRGTVYKGQPVVVSYYLYTDQMVRSYNLDDEQDYQGYGKGTYEQPGMLNYETVSYQGKRFQRALIKRLVLLPNEVGRLQVPQLKGTARIYEFGYLSQNLVSQDQFLEVLPLPEKGVPQGFSGAVGSFNISETISAREINLGEAITFSLRIAGTGNFNQFANPGFESGTAQISSPVAVDRLNAGIDGSRTLYYTIIPSDKGSFSLPKLSFSWFDPDSRSYHSYSRPDLDVTVKSANVISYFSGLLEGSTPKTINPMLSRPVYPQYGSYLNSLWYWLSAIMTVLAMGISAYFALDKKRRRSDPGTWTRQQASRKLKRYLQESGEAAKRGSSEFYATAERGFMQFLSDKYGIPKGLSTAEKVQQLSEHEISEDLLAQSSEFLERCARARFAPDADSELQITEDYIALNHLVRAFSKMNGKGAGK